jgi:hypothetical protein
MKIKIYYVMNFRLFFKLFYHEYIECLEASKHLVAVENQELAVEHLSLVYMHLALNEDTAESVLAKLNNCFDLLI